MTRQVAALPDLDQVAETSALGPLLERERIKREAVLVAGSLRQDLAAAHQAAGMAAAALGTEGLVACSFGS